MRNYDIKYKAQQLVHQSTSKYSVALIFIALLGTIPSLLNNPVLCLIVTLILICAGQGNITSSYKVYENRSESIETYDDGLYGIIHIKDLFGTYFIYNLIKVVVIAIVALIGAIIMGLIFGRYMTELIDYLNYGGGLNVANDFLIMMAAGKIIFYIVLPILMMVIITSFIFDTLFFPVFYLLNEQRYKGIGAMSEAKLMMKSHFKQLLTLKLSYFGGFCLTFIVTFIPAMILMMMDFISSDFISIFVILFFAVIQVLIYRRQYQMALLIFYEEVLKAKEKQEDESYDSLYKQKLRFITNIDSDYEYNIVDNEMNTKDGINIITDDEFYEPMSTSNILKGIFIYLPLYFVIISEIVIFIFKLLIKALNITDINFVNAYLNVAVDGLYVLFALLLFKEVFIYAFKGFKEKVWSHLLMFLLKGYGCIYLSSLVSNLLLMLLSVTQESANQTGIETLITAYPIPLFIATVFFAPIAEEFVFRYIIFRSIRKKNVILAHLISAFLFGFIHVSTQVLGYGNFTEMIQIIPYFAMGLVFSLAYEKKKTLSAPITLHLLNNLIATIVVMFL